MQNSLSSKDILSIGEASEYLGISIDTLRRWEKRGRIVAYRSPGGHRYFKRNELDDLFGMRYTRDENLLFEGTTFGQNTKSAEGIDPTPSLETISEKGNVDTFSNHYPTPPVDTPPAPIPPITTSYSYFAIPEIKPTEVHPIEITPVVSTETVTSEQRENPEVPPLSPISNTEPIQSLPTENSLSEEKTEAPSILKPLTTEGIVPQQEVAQKAPVTPVMTALPHTLSFHEILKDQNEVKTSPSYVKYIVAGIIIFTVIDIIFALLWFNSGSTISPIN